MLLLTSVLKSLAAIASSTTMATGAIPEESIREGASWGNKGFVIGNGDADNRRTHLFSSALEFLRDVLEEKEKDEGGGQGRGGKGRGDGKYGVDEEWAVFV